MWTADKIFNRETFEAWLASQPGDRGFEYADCQKCALCNFIAETTNAPLFAVGPFAFTVRPEYTTDIPLPEWIVKLLDVALPLRVSGSPILTIDHIRRAYQKLFNIDVCAEYPAVEVIQQPIEQPTA